ncbi:MAG: pseudouridine synthase [Mariprofundales bacterium]
MRLNRYLARCGLCSRRQADILIAQKRVSIHTTDDKDIFPDVGYKVQDGDIVSLDNKIVSPLKTHTWIAYHKPRGLMCSRKDNRGRDLIYNHINVAANIQSVGRLDMNSEGLLLLTDDGDGARTLTLPANNVARCYRIRVEGVVDEACLQRLRHGSIAMGLANKGQYEEYSVPWKVKNEQQLGNYAWLNTTLHCGRWREIRRTLEALEHPVRRLIRIRFGNIKIDNLTAGEYRQLTSEEVKALLSHAN